MSIMVAAPALNLGFLADAIVATKTLAGALLRLYQNDVFPTPNTPLSAYEAADYTGNGDEAVTWLTPSIADDGAAEVVGTSGEFRPTDAVTPNTIYGVNLLKADGITLLGSARFDVPIAMNSTTDSILVTVRVRPDAGGLAVSIS